MLTVIFCFSLLHFYSFCIGACNSVLTMCSYPNFFLVFKLVDF